MTDFTSHTPEMLAMLKLLVETESPSHDKTGVDRVGAIIAAECRRQGALVTFHPQTTVGDLVEARWGEGRDGTGTIVE